MLSNGLQSQSLYKALQTRKELQLPRCALRRTGEMRANPEGAERLAGDDV